MSNNTDIEHVAALYGCTIIEHNSGALQGLYASYKGQEELLCHLARCSEPHAHKSDRGMQSIER